MTSRVKITDEMVRRFRSKYPKHITAALSQASDDEGDRIVLDYWINGEPEIEIPEGMLRAACEAHFKIMGMGVTKDAAETICRAALQWQRDNPKTEGNA